MEENMVQAPWVYMVDDACMPGGIIAKNFLTGKIFTIPPGKIELPMERTRDRYWREILKAEKFLVPRDGIIPVLREYRHLEYYGYAENYQRAALLATSACNFGCKFCINEELRGAQKEERLQVSKLADILIEYFSNSPAESWRLDVTGGEPTLVADYVMELGKILRDTAVKRGRKFMLFLITNGYKLSPSLIREFMDIGLAGIQVSLEIEHDSVRMLKNGSKTLDVILQNLSLAPSNLSVNIATNVKLGAEPEFQAEQADGLRRLLTVSAPFLKKLVKSWSLSPYVPKLSPEKNPKTARYFRFFWEKETGEYLNLYQIVLDAGYPPPSLMPKIQCEAPRVSENLAINSAGKCFVCPSLVGDQAFATGFMNGRVTGEGIEYLRDETSWLDLCVRNGKICPFFTVCNTGCRMTGVSKGYSWGTPNCEKIFFDRFTRFALERWAKERLS